jgi:hypothetical protein
MLLRLLLLGPYEQEIEDGKHEDYGNKRAKASSFSARSGTTCSHGIYQRIHIKTSHDKIASRFYKTQLVCLAAPHAASANGRLRCSRNKGISNLEVNTPSFCGSLFDTRHSMSL